MKKFLIPFFAGALLITSCSRDGSATPAPAPTPPATVVPDKINDFVWKGLNSWYYWQKDVAQLADSFDDNPTTYANFLNGKKPDELFYSLLHQYKTVDRFSWIVSDVNQLLAGFSGESKSSGLDMGFYLKESGNNVNVVAIVNYVVPNSPASQAGMKRGDVISAVNGADLTVNNYTQLLSDSFKATVAKEVTQTTTGIVTSGVEREATINAVVLQEDPVAFTKVFNYDGKKIGYLVYNGFQANYNDELNAAFGRLKTEGVTELILDLRYNGGGSVSSAVALGQMITGGHTGKPYVIMDFNDKHKVENYTANLSSDVNIYSYSNGTTSNTGKEAINSLNLSRVYVLTARGTASASELTIMGLKPYINVVTIGSETYGKYVGSITLYDSPSSDYTNGNTRNTSHTWAMQPITFAYYNGRKDAHPTAGIPADYGISPFKHFGVMKEFGNVADPSLNKALELITGKVQTTGRMVEYNNPRGFIGDSNTLKQFGTELYIHDMKEFKK